MRIKEFWITRYGPLPNTGQVLLGDFNLFFGKNEEGKTLTIDALVKLILGRHVKDFRLIDRVDEKPDGSVIIQHEDGKETKLPEKGDLTKIADLTSAECRNIFVIRNSNLSIARESQFYTNVTEKLTGLRTEEISHIKKKLQELGKLTRPDSEADLSDLAPFGKIKSRVKHACDLIEEIDKLLDKIKENRFDELEEQLAEYREERERTQEHIDSFEDAGKREKYEKGKESLDTLNAAMKSLEELRDYTEQDRDLWRENEKALQDSNEQKEKLLIVLRQAEESFTEVAQKLEEKEIDFQVMEQKKEEIGEVEREIKELISLGPTRFERKKEFHEIQKNAEAIERDFEILSKRKEEIDKQIKPELKDYEMKMGEFARQEVKTKFLTPIGVLSTILLGISLLGAIVRPSPLFYTLIVLFLIVAVVSFFFKRQSVSNTSWLVGEFDRIKLTCSKFEVGAETVEEVLSKIQSFEEKVSRKALERETMRQKKSDAESVFHLHDDKIKKSSDRITEAAAKFGWGENNPEEYLRHIEEFKESHYKKSKELEAARIEKESLGNKIGDLKGNRIPEKDMAIKKARDRIDDVRLKSGEGSIEDYTKKLKLKQDYEKSKREQETVLNSHFRQTSAAPEESISYWTEQVHALEEYMDRAKDIKYDEKTISRLEEKEEGLGEKIEELTQNMGVIDEEMRTVERKTNESLQFQEHLYCETSVDLKVVKERLQDFVDENETNKEIALGVIQTFEGIEREEKEKVSELFGKDSLVSNYFSEITDGLYDEVIFNQETGEIEVKRKDGVTLEAEKLSGGAYDQLYLSIRLALGEKLLKGKKGFFIMDDPFVKADIDRLHRQIETLKNICELGWQVLYFSAKDEIKHALKEYIDQGVVKCVEIQGISFASIVDVLHQRGMNGGESLPAMEHPPGAD